MVPTVKKANSWVLSLSCVLAVCGCGNRFERSNGGGSSGQAGQEFAGSAGRESTGDAGKTTGSSGNTGRGGSGAKGGQKSGGEAGQDGGGTAGTAHAGTGGRTAVGGTTSRGGSSAPAGSSSGGASEAGHGGENTAGHAGETPSAGGTDSFGGKTSVTGKGGRSSGGTSGTAEGGAAGTTEVGTGGAGQGGEIGTGGSGAQPPELTGPCETMGAFACNVGNKKLPLYCNSDHVWAARDVCDGDYNCDSTDGTCKPILEECADKAGGESFCATYGDVLYTCGPDLVTISERTCDGLCLAGACQEPRCGDGKLQAGEECDDGNLVTSDVCQPDCRLTMVVQLVAGYNHTCALLSGGDVRCWGGNSYGQLGQGNTDFIGDNEEVNSVPPVDVGGKVVLLAAGAAHICALLEGGSVRCWGHNGWGQLGYGNQEYVGDDETPADAGDVDVGGRVVSISAGESQTCALLEGGKVRCWGRGDLGVLGYGNEDCIGDDEVPANVGDAPLGYAAASIGSGSAHNCAIIQDGKLLCWGDNASGQLGYGDLDSIGDNELPSSVASPIAFGSRRKVVELGLGTAHTCALFDDGTVRCWGANGRYQVGLADSNIIYSSAVDVSELSFGVEAAHIASRYGHNCIVTNEGNLRCWGLNTDGQLGMNSKTSSITAADATDVVLDGEVTAMTLGYHHTCVVVDHTRVRCWGPCNESGQSNVTGVLGACTGSELIFGDDEAILTINPVRLFDD